MKKDLTIYKFLAFGAIGLYLYKLSQAQGKSLGGDTGKLVDHVMLHANIHPNIEPFVRNAAKSMVDKVVEKHNGMKTVDGTEKDL